jgi:hypothetical protein
MNILIVSNKRTGAYQICKWLQKELSHLYSFGIESPETEIDYKVIINPFSEKNEKYVDNFYKIENSIVLVYFEDYKNFIVKNNDILEKHFDFTICIKRENHKEHAESLLWTLQNNIQTEQYSIPNDWLTKYSYELYSLEKKLKLEYEEMKQILGLHVNYEFLFNNHFKRDIYYIVSYIGFIEKFASNFVKETSRYRKLRKINLI